MPRLYRGARVTPAGQLPIDEATINKEKLDRIKTFNRLPPPQSNIMYVHVYMEGFPEWFHRWLPVTYRKQDVARVGEIQKAKFVNLNKQQLNQELLNMPHETISYKLIIAYCQIAMMEEVKAVTAGLDEIVKLIEEAVEYKLLSEEVADGLLYLHSVLVSYKEFSYCDLEEVEGGLEPDQFAVSYYHLPAQGLLSVKATQALFLGCCRSFEDQVRITEEIVDEDPDTLEWSISLLMVNKMQRKERDGYLYPTEEEWDLLHKCLAIDPEHIMVTVFRMTIIADCLRCKTAVPLDFTDTLGLSFKTAGEAMHFIESQARIIRNQMPHSVRIIGFIVESVSKRIPHRFRNYKLAKECLRVGLTINPKSSKLNHQMAVIYIQEKGYEAALEYCRTALDSDIRNNPAFTDYMNLLLKNVGDSAAEITEVMERREAESSSGTGLAITNSVKGIFYFMSDRKRDAFNIWTIANGYSSDEPGKTLDDVTSRVRRFQWDQSLISYDTLLKFLSDTLRTEGATVGKRLTPTDMTFLKELIARLETNHSNSRHPFTVIPGRNGRGGRTGSQSGCGRGGENGSQSDHGRGGVNGPQSDRGRGGGNGPQSDRGRGRGNGPQSDRGGNGPYNDRGRGRGKAPQQDRSRGASAGEAGTSANENTDGSGSTVRRADAVERESSSRDGINEVAGLFQRLGRGWGRGFRNRSTEEPAGHGQPARGSGLGNLRNLIRGRGRVPYHENVREREPVNPPPERGNGFLRFRGRGRGLLGLNRGVGNDSPETGFEN